MRILSRQKKNDMKLKLYLDQMLARGSSIAAGIMINYRRNDKLEAKNTNLESLRWICIIILGIDIFELKCLMNSFR